MMRTTPDLQDYSELQKSGSYPLLLGRRKWMRFLWYPILYLLVLVGSGLAIDSLRHEGISWIDIGIMLLMFNLLGVGGEAGMHRLFAHKSYKTSTPVRVLLAIAGTMVGEAPIIEYVAYHRYHHLYSDQIQDLHSPLRYEGKGIGIKLKNIWHAFMGWKYDAQAYQTAMPEKYAKDILAEPAMVFINHYFYAIVLLSFLFPALLGFGITGTLHGAWIAFLWGGCVRFLVMTLMGDLFVRVGCHLMGTSPFIDPVNSNSRNLWILAIPSLGLSWHNNHHAFPDSARLNLDWWQIDPSGSFIALLEKLRLAWQVKHPSPEQIKAKRTNLATI